MSTLHWSRVALELHRYGSLHYLRSDFDPALRGWTLMFSVADVLTTALQAGYASPCARCGGIALWPYSCVHCLPPELPDPQDTLAVWLPV